MKSYGSMLVLLLPTAAAAEPRFESAPQVYEVPSSDTAGGFSSTGMGTGNKFWVLYDMNGDKKPDLVQTADPKNADATYGINMQNPHWHVYAGTGSEFTEKNSPNWGVPNSGTAGSFRTFAAGQTVRQWVVMNFEYRQRSMLLQTLDPATNKVWITDEGKPYWKAFRVDSNARFSDKFIKVLVGKSGKDKGFSSVASGSGTDQWTLLDMNKDGRLDLVQTADPATGKVWKNGPTKKSWRVYYNNPGAITDYISMETPTTWDVPEAEGLPETGFNMMARGDGTKQWVTFDIDGDGYPDLVHTQNPATGKVWGLESGNPHWRVYKKASNAWGFSTTPIQWTVPDSGTADGFDAATRGGSGKNWVTIDLNADGKPDLVQTSSPGTDKVWGSGTPNPYWKMFVNLGGSFNKVATTFLVPDSGTADGFYSITQGDGTKQWTTVDIDGDGRLDLVHTADPKTGDVWKGLARGTQAPGQLGMPKINTKTFWRVFRGIP